MSKQIESNPSRVSFDPEDVDIERLDEIADEREMSRAELIRDQLKTLIDQETDTDHTSELHTPENERLREAFEALLDLSNHPLGPRPVTVDEAKDRLYSRECSKASVKRRLLKPLEELGFITVRSARIFVHRRTVKQVKDVEETAVAEQQQLEAADRSTSGSHRERLDETYQELLKYQRAGLNPPSKCIAWVSARTLWGDDIGSSV